MTGPYRASSGAVLHVEEVEGASGPTLLALHGLGGGAWFFRGLARRLAPALRVVAIDLPGTGRSSAGRSPIGIARWVADIGDLVTDRFPDPIVLLGHSLGTIISLEAWTAWPERIRAMVFVGGLPEPRPLIRERLSARADLVERQGLAGLGPAAAAAVLGRATMARRPELAAMFERLFELQDPESYVRCCRLLIGACATAVPSTVTVPALSISGSEDQYAPPELIADFMREVPGSRASLVLPGCGHLPFLEAPESFAAAVGSFVKSLC